MVVFYKMQRMGYIRSPHSFGGNMAMELFRKKAILSDWSERLNEVENPESDWRHNE